jgi:glycine/D-amino acid oxidase-like deaminating enzyme
MDLRSGCQYWTQKQGDHPPSAPTLARNLRTRVAILGGGITGAMAAHYLTQANVECVLVDRRDIARGSTAASTGLLQYEIDKPLVELAKLVGQPTATRAYQLGVDALDEFERLTQWLGDDCGFARTQSLFLANDPTFAQLLREECDARRAIGLRVEYLGAADLERDFHFTRPAAILSHEAARIDPVRVTSALIERATNAGLQSFGHTQIDRYESGGRGGGVTLTTNTGHRLRADHVLFATGYETPEFLKDLPVTLKSTYALAARITTQHSGLSTQDFPLIWETGTPYFYARRDADHLIAGGEDDPFDDPETRDARIPRKSASILKKLQALFPYAQLELDCAWAGTFAETPDSLPFIGPHADFPRGLFALGYGGNGITFGLIAAQLLRDRILGRANPDQDLFRFDR